jgi:integrase
VNTRTIVICETHGVIKASDRDAHVGCRLTEKTQRFHLKKGLIKGKRCSHSKDAKQTCEHSWMFQKTFGRTADGKPKQYRFAIDDKAGRHIAAESDAEELAFGYWKQIKAGTFEKREEPAPEPTVLTLARLFELAFADRRENDKDNSMKGIILRTALTGLDGVTRPLGDWQVAPMMTITPDDVEAYKKVRSAEGVEQRTKNLEARRARVAEELRALRAKPELSKPERLHLAAVERDQVELASRSVSDGERSINRELQLWRAVHNWGILKKKTNSTPFKVRAEDGSVGAVKLFKEFPRRRRLRGDERRRLLAACSAGDGEKKGGTDLRALVEVALDTCFRIGELRSLQWSQVDWARNKIFLEAENTKSGKLRKDGSGDRWVPMTEKVRSFLEMRKTGPDGKERKPTDYVFGRVDGTQIKSIKTAWKLACRRAGIRGLHFHDLRREAGSTMKESGMPEHYVQRVLGHANIKTTSTYLAGTDEGLEEYFARYERKRAKDAAEKDAHGDAHGSKAEPAREVIAEISE